MYFFNIIFNKGYSDIYRCISFFVIKYMIIFWLKLVILFLGLWLFEGKLVCGSFFYIFRN